MLVRSDGDMQNQTLALFRSIAYTSGWIATGDTLRLLVCSLMLLCGAPLIALPGLPAQETSAAAGGTRPPLWDPAGLQDFSLTDRTEETVTKQTLSGKEWVAGFIFTRCKGPCPAVVGQMKLLQERTGVTLVTFSVQPEVDTPAVLRSFSKTYVSDAKPDANGQTPKWYWLTGDRAQIYNLIGKSFRLPVAETKGPDGPDVIHSFNLMHVDENGRVLGKYNALEEGEMVLLRKILQGKEPRGKMVAEIPAAPAGQPVEIEGAAATGLTFTRTKSEEPEEPPAVAEWILALPALNASLNGLATILLITGYVLIKSGRVTAHKWVMLSSFGTSVIFLGSYLIYHFHVLSKKFPGTGLIKTVYLAILISHIILAAAVPVLASMTIYRALRGQWDRHKAIARITFPIWVYVSVTGVIIYLMLYQWPAAA